MPALALLAAALALYLIAAALASPPAEAAYMAEAPGAPAEAPPAQAGQVPDLASLAPVAAPAEALAAQLGQETGVSWQLPASGEQYRELIVQAELASGLPPLLLARTLYEESRFRPEIVNGTVTSSAGAQGIAQFMPATARGAGIDPLDPRQAIPAAARELRAMFDKFGSWTEALAAYNWGQGNLGRKGIGAAPGETRRYVQAIAGDVGLS